MRIFFFFARSLARSFAHARTRFAALGQPIPTECSICMDTLASEDPLCHLSMLRCTHTFHWDCIDSWLGGKTEKGTCPVCRTWSI